eukprot:403358702
MEQKQLQQNIPPSLKDFVFEKVLSNDVTNKQIYLLGHMKNGLDINDKALLKLEKLAFEEKDLQKLGRKVHSTPACDGNEEIKDRESQELIEKDEHYFQNDIYNKMFIWMNKDISKIQCDFAYPAPQSQIDKYTAQESFIIHETSEMYFKYVKPLYIEKLEPIQWIENVLDGVSEMELQLYRSKDFTVKIDWKMNSEDLETLHLLVFPYDRKLKTIRDLTQEHLPLLEEMLSLTNRLISETYKLPLSQIRAFFHYHPTFYNLHIHFTHVSQLEKVGAFLGRGHSLEDVIDNIKMKGDYYQTKTIMVSLGENNGVYRVLKENGQI